MVPKLSDNQFCQETQDWSRAYREPNAHTRFPVMDIEERLRAVEKHLALSIPTEEMMNKYPVLRDAYEQFRIIYRMTAEHEKFN